jgi:hypothetical protein
MRIRVKKQAIGIWNRVKTNPAGTVELRQASRVENRR